MVKVKLQPHPNSIKVHQIYLHILFALAIIIGLFFLSFLVIVIITIVGFFLIFFLIQRFVNALQKKVMRAEINESYLVYDGEKIPLDQLKSKSNFVEKRFGILRNKTKKWLVKRNPY